MTVIWSATDPASRRFVPAPLHTGPADLQARFDRLRRRRIRGYIEVALPYTGSPRLTVGFRGPCAVIHMIEPAAVPRSFVLAGDGSVPAGAYVQVPIMDELTRFDGEVVLEVDYAWDLVCAFLDTGQTAGLGEWQALRHCDSATAPDLSGVD